MNMDKLTTDFQAGLFNAQSKAVQKDNQFIEPLHVIFALLEYPESTVGHILSQSGIKIGLIREKNRQVDRQTSQPKNNNLFRRILLF